MLYLLLFQHELICITSNVSALLHELRRYTDNATFYSAMFAFLTMTAFSRTFILQLLEVFFVLIRLLLRQEEWSYLSRQSSKWLQNCYILLNATKESRTDWNSSALLPELLLLLKGWCHAAFSLKDRRFVRMLQINPESTWITGKVTVGAVAFQCSVTRTDLGQVSMSPNLIRKTTQMDQTCISFHFGYFVLFRLFEKHFYTK